jgi:hypothetical protein
MEQRQYKGPERRSQRFDSPYAGPERRKLDWPFKPLREAERAEGNADKATPGRADVKP